MADFVPYDGVSYSEEEQRERSATFFALMNHRRTIRTFSSRPVSGQVLQNILRTAGSAPSGAHKQPWRFVVVTDPSLKQQIRVAAEKEEKESYERRMPQEWLDDLEPFGTDWHKEFLETAPALIAVFSLSYEKVGENIKKNYYVKESVGIACGFLLAAIEYAGLVSLTHTPSPMEFLSKILHRPENEKPFLLIPIGYPAEGVTVPNIERKTLDEICIWQ